MQVDLALAPVAGEGSFDAVPQRVQVQDSLTVGGFLGVPLDQIGFLDPDRAGADGLDLDQCLDVEDGTVGVSGDEVARLSFQRNLAVPEVLPDGSTGLASNR